jgi:hypothetical protein
LRRKIGGQQAKVGGEPGFVLTADLAMFMFIFDRLDRMDESSFSAKNFVSVESLK